MPSRIEDYALVGDCESAALISRSGSVDWLCWPRFDSPACFAALLGNEQNGHWLLAPAQPLSVARRYRAGTLILESEWVCTDGRVMVTDFMPMQRDGPRLFRLVEGIEGSVAMTHRLAPRFEFGSTMPWVTWLPARGGLRLIAGADQLALYTTLPLQEGGSPDDMAFTLHAGEHHAFELAWQSSMLPSPLSSDGYARLAETDRDWVAWSSRYQAHGRWGLPIRQSLIVLKALTYAPSGGIVAAPTTSLPASLGAGRNWDYRYCWVRDAALTLLTLMSAGYYDEAFAWREWLLRAVAGAPGQLQSLYGIGGERWLDERIVPWLAGYEGRGPVRIGNAAAGQFQLDVYGELMGALHHARQHDPSGQQEAWRLQCALLGHLEHVWHRPDCGIWESRARPQHHTHSKVMAWVAFDRAIQSACQFGLPAPLDRWRAQRERIRQDVLQHGVDAKRGCFVQAYGSTALDASLLRIPLVGFLPAGDERMKATVAALQRELSVDGLLMRYRLEQTDDGVAGGEGAFLACSFWLATVLHMQGRCQEAAELYERLLALRNDVGLLAEEFDPTYQRALGNFPQAFSHMGIIHAGLTLMRDGAPISSPRFWG